MGYTQFEILNKSIITCALGLFLGTLFDVLSFAEIYIKCLSKKHTIPWTIVFNRDVSFSVMSTVSFTIAMYYLNSGVFRGMYLVSTILGFFI